MRNPQLKWVANVLFEAFLSKIFTLLAVQDGILCPLIMVTCACNDIKMDFNFFNCKIWIDRHKCRPTRHAKSQKTLPHVKKELFQMKILVVAKQILWICGQVFICEERKRPRRGKSVFNADKLALEDVTDLSSDRLQNEWDYYTNGNTWISKALSVPLSIWIKSDRLR